jgi:hypothetical protein
VDKARPARWGVQVAEALAYARIAGRGGHRAVPAGRDTPEFAP